MAFIQWNDRLKLNITICDEQHKKLIEIINSLHETYKSAKDKDVTSKTIEDLMAYTQYHFKTEEDLFDKYNYPYSTRHKIEHAELTNQVAAYSKRFGNGESVSISELLSFLKDWVNDHIIGSDRNYAPFLRSKGYTN